MLAGKRLLIGKGVPKVNWSLGFVTDVRMGARISLNAALSAVPSEALKDNNSRFINSFIVYVNKYMYHEVEISIIK